MTGNEKERRKRSNFGRIRSVWQLKTDRDKGLENESKFLARITDYGCELRFAKEDSEFILGLFVCHDSKTSK